MKKVFNYISFDLVICLIGFAIGDTYVDFFWRKMFTTLQKLLNFELIQFLQTQKFIFKLIVAINFWVLITCIRYRFVTIKDEVNNKNIQKK